MYRGAVARQRCRAVAKNKGRAGNDPGKQVSFSAWPSNQILRLLPASAVSTLTPFVKEVELATGDTLFEPGQQVQQALFPLGGTVVTLVLPMQDGRAVEAATIGREGAVGAIVTIGDKPAFARGTVQIGGKAMRIPVARLEQAKKSSPKLHEIMVRYSDCLIAQVFQSVGCATVHPLEARCARWLLTTQDRLRASDIPITQEALSEMFGVGRTYMTRIANDLQNRGAISYHRGLIHIERRPLLEKSACECYDAVRRHFDRILPGLYPKAEP